MYIEANDKQQVKQIYKKYICERLKELGTVGYIKFLGEKAIDVTFEPMYVLSHWTSSWWGNYTHITHIVNFIWDIFILGIIISLFRKSKSKMELFFKLYPLVILILLLFTETNSRYLIGSLPVLCISAVYKT
jgi:hypothetical protein